MTAFTKETCGHCSIYFCKLCRLATSLSVHDLVGISSHPVFSLTVTDYCTVEALDTLSVVKFVKLSHLAQNALAIIFI